MDCTDAYRGVESRWHERQFADAQALAHVGSWERALTGERAIWSDELCRIFGLPCGTALTDAEFLALVHPDDRARVRPLGTLVPLAVADFALHTSTCAPPRVFRWTLRRPLTVSVFVLWLHWIQSSFDCGSEVDQPRMRGRRMDMGEV